MKRIACLLLCPVLCCALFACGRAEGPGATPAEPDTTAPPADYFDMVWGWECPPGEYASYIDAIYHTERGTAGSSGKAALSAVVLLAFSNAASQDGATRDTMQPAFASMNDAQALFFASQWIRLRSLADEAISAPERFQEEYGWAGLERFDASLYSRERINHLDDLVSLFLCRDEMR